MASGSSSRKSSPSRAGGPKGPHYRLVPVVVGIALLGRAAELEEGAIRTPGVRVEAGPGNRQHVAVAAAFRAVFGRPASSDDDILRAISVDRAALAPGLPIQEISCGVPFIYVPLSSRAEVDRAEPNQAAGRRLRSAFGGDHAAVFLFAVEPPDGEITAYSRMFASGLGVAEDPATGGASGPLGCYLVAHGLVPPAGWHDMVGLKGVRMQRPSRIHMRITAATSDAITRVQVGGRAVRIGSGSIDVT